MKNIMKIIMKNNFKVGCEVDIDGRPRAKSKVDGPIFELWGGTDRQIKF